MFLKFSSFMIQLLRYAQSYPEVNLPRVHFGISIYS